MNHLMRLAPIPYLGICIKGDPILSTTLESRRRGDYSALMFDQGHWILFGSYGGNEFLMDPSVFGQVSAVCGLYCIILLFKLVCEGERAAETLYTRLRGADDATAGIRHLESQELELVESVQELLLAASYAVGV